MSQPNKCRRQLRARVLGAAAILLSGLGGERALAEAIDHAPSDAPAQPGPASSESIQLRHAVGADFSLVSYAWSGRPYSASAFGASYRLAHDQLEAVLGARGLVSSTFSGALFEAFAAGALTPALGFWHPSLGVELGYSSLPNAERRSEPKPPPGVDEDSRPHLGRVYLSLAAAPLRACWGPITVSALELAVGTTLPDLGRGFRVALALAHLEWRLK